VTKQDAKTRLKTLRTATATRVAVVIGLSDRMMREYVIIGALAAEQLACEKRLDENAKTKDLLAKVAEQVPTVAQKTLYRIVNAGAVARVIIDALAPDGYDVAYVSDEEDEESRRLDYEVHDSVSPLAGVAYMTLTPLYQFLQEDKSEELRDAGRATVLRLWAEAVKIDGVPKFATVDALANPKSDDDEGSDEETGNNSGTGDEETGPNNVTAGAGDDTVTVTLSTASLETAVRQVSDQIEGLAKSEKVDKLLVWRIFSAAARVMSETGTEGFAAGVDAFAKTNSETEQ
jgi:hypothetical protein